MSGGFRVGAERTGLSRCCRVVFHLVEVSETKRVARAVDVALDELGFESSSARVDLETLDNPRHSAENENGDDEHGRADNRQTPTTRERGKEEEQNENSGDSSEDLITGNINRGFGEPGTRGNEAL